MSTSAASAVYSWPRAALETGIWILLAAIALETWFLAGLAVPCRVVGDSMAETLLGVHREVVCADCGRRFACGAQEVPATKKAVCPNCGFAANDLDALPDIAGRRLLIDRQAFSLRRPRRWEVVALRNPRRADEIIVKRVVGLPGENVEIRDGDIFINGEIQRKNLAEQHAMAVLVHDEACRPTIEPAPPPRWRADSAESRWRPADRGFWHVSSKGTVPFSLTRKLGQSPENEPIDWLIYHHWRRLASGRCEPSPVTDVCGYNQTRPRREEDVHPVPDLLLSFRLAEISGRGAFFVRATDGREEFEVRLEFEGEPPRPVRYVAYREGKPIAGAAGDLPSTGKEPAIEASLIDRRFMLAINGRTVFALPYERTGERTGDCPDFRVGENGTVPLAAPLAIGAKGLSAEIRDLRVYRDVYYGRAIGTPGKALTPDPSPQGRGEGKYFVLGDNSPISEDSRDWPDGGGVGVELFVGKPIVSRCN